jgi:predicted nucleic acid-binding protein
LYYIDTSILAAYYCPETLSDRVQAFLTDQVKPAVSALTEVEFLSAVSRKVRTGELSRADGNRIASKFQSHLNQDLFTVCPIETLHWQMAGGWLRLFNTPLKTLDALHLAVASGNDLILLTSDHRLAVAADALGIRYRGL